MVAHLRWHVTTPSLHALIVGLSDYSRALRWCKRHVVTLDRKLWIWGPCGMLMAQVSPWAHAIEGDQVRMNRLNGRAKRGGSDVARAIRAEREQCPLGDGAHTWSFDGMENTCVCGAIGGIAYMGRVPIITCRRWCEDEEGKRVWCGKQAVTMIYREGSAQGRVGACEDHLGDWPGRPTWEENKKKKAGGVDDSADNAHIR